MAEGGQVQANRFHSPFKHWLSGLGAEVLAFGAFILVVAAAMALLVWLLQV